MHIYLSLLFVFCSSGKAQDNTEQEKENIRAEIKYVTTNYGPNSMVRAIKQDRKSNIWIASWQDIIRYDGRSFTNITSELKTRKFWSVLEDSKGNLWFGTMGFGVFYYDGKAFKNFTSDDGLVDNEIGCIYEDKIGNIWFGATGGVSRYDGKSFRNYVINGDSMSEDRPDKSLQNSTRPRNEVNSIIEDKAGKFWFGTRGNTFVYDGKTFTVFAHDGKPFTNVRTMIEDKKGNIWLGGKDGLWRYDGNTFSNFTANFSGYIYEDKKGNIWTSTEESPAGKWALSRYEEKSLSDKKPTATIIKSNEGMIFGILEAYDGGIWFGTLSGVYRYDGKTFTDFKGKESSYD